MMEPHEDVVSKPQPQNNDKLSTSPKSLLKQIAKVNETLPPSQPDNSPTIHLVPLQTSEKRYSRRSSGILATVNTPKTLINRFLTEAPTETPVVPSNMTGNTSSLERSSVPLPAKVMDSSHDYRDLSVTGSDLEEAPVLGSESMTSEGIASKLPDSQVGFQKISTKGLKRPRRQITAQDIADGVKRSQDAEEDDEISLQRPKIVIKLRKKITAEDFAMGIKQSQEAAAATEAKPTDVTEMSTSDSSLGFLTVNSENTENFLDTTNVAVGDGSDESDLSEKCSNEGSKQSKSDAVQSEKNLPNSSEIKTEKGQPTNILDVNQLYLEESLKVLRDASNKHISTENLHDKSEKRNNSVSSQARKSTSMTETISSFQLSQNTTKDTHTSHVNLANSSSSSLSFLKKLTVSLTDISCSGNQQSMTASTKDFLNSAKSIKSKDEATLIENKEKEKDQSIRENKVSDSPSSSDSEFNASRKTTYKKGIESKQDAAAISSNRNSDWENITEEKPSVLKEVTTDIGSLQLKEKSTNFEETKTGQSDVTTDKDTSIEDIVGMSLETKDVEYTSEFIQTFSLESSNEESVSSNVSQNKTDEKIQVSSKNEMEACTQEMQNIADQHESKNDYGRMLERHMELNEKPVKDFVPVDNNVVLEIHKEMVVIEDENEVIEVQDEPIVEILDEEYIRLHKEDLMGINQEAAFVYQTENKDQKNLQKENQMTLNEDIEKKHDHHTEKITEDVQDDKMKSERETRKEKELSSNVKEIVVTCIDEARRKSGVGKNSENILQDKADVTIDEEEISVTKSKVEVSTAQEEEEDIPMFEVESLSENEVSEISEVDKSTKGKNRSVNQSKGDASIVYSEEVEKEEAESLSQVEIGEILGKVDKNTKGENKSVSQSEGDASIVYGEEEEEEEEEEDIPLFEVESLSQTEISEVDESEKGENASVHQCEGNTSTPHVKTNSGLTLEKSENKAFQNKDDTGKIQDKSGDNIAQNKTEIDMILVESKADGKQSNKTGVTQDESEIHIIQNKRKADMVQNKSKGDVTHDESEAWVTQGESEAGETQDESEADATREENKTGVSQDESEAGASQGENVDVESQKESEDYVSETESKESASDAESEVAVTQHKHNLSGIQEEFETGAVQNDSKTSVTQDRSKSSMIQHEVDVIPEESEAGVTQEESEIGETQEESEVDKTQEESGAGETQAESEVGESQEESEVGKTQEEESEAGETQEEESEAGETQEEESEAGKTQEEETEAGETQEESEAGKTQEESEAGETQEESETGETQEESEAGKTQEEESEARKSQEESETGDTQEENEAGKTQERNKIGTKQDNPEFSASSDENKITLTHNESEIMTNQKKKLTRTRDGKRTEDQYTADVMQDEDMLDTTKEQEFSIKVKSVRKSKSISSARELAEDEIQVDDDIIFQQNIEHSKEDYSKGKESQTTTTTTRSSLRKRSSVIKSSVSPRPSTSRDLSLKHRGTKRKSASDLTAEAAQVSARSVKEKLRRQSRETNLSKTRSYRIVDSLSGIGDSMTTSNQAIKQVPLDVETVPKENQHLQKTSQQISTAESSKILESTQPKKRLKEANQIAKRKHKEYVVPPQVTASLLNHYSKLLFPTSCADMLGLISNDYFDNLFATLSSYSRKQRRLSICQSDVELYFNNVGFTNEHTSLNSLIREHLSLVDQQKLIPVARAVTTFDNTDKNSKRKSKTKDASSIFTSK